MIKRCGWAALFALLAATAQAQDTDLAVNTLRIASTGSSALKVGCTSSSTTCTGTIRSGPIIVNSVGIVGSDGRIPAISSTYFASLSGANITGVTEANITDGSLLARVADAETISGLYTFTNATGIRINSTAPLFNLYETDAAANNGRYRLAVDGGGTLTLQTINDAENSTATVLQVARSGTTVSSLTIGAATTLNGNGAVGAPAYAFTNDGTGTATDSGIYYSGGVAVANHGSQVALFASSLVTLGKTTTIAGNAADTGLSVTGNSGTPLVLNRLTSDGTMIDLQQDSSSEGSITVSGTTVAYNTFLGSHYTQLMPGQVAPEPGMVVVSAGKAIPALPRRLTAKAPIYDVFQQRVGEQTIDIGPAPDSPDVERFVYVEPSSRRNQRGVYGVWHADLGRTAAGMSWGDPDAEVYQVGGLGLRQVWVTDTCGPVQNGMLLATSPITGLAEAQCTVGAGGKPSYDPVQRDYTLGKALIDVDWSKVAPDEDGVRKLLVSAVLFAG